MDRLANREEIGAISGALGRLLKAWPGGEPPRVLKSAGLPNCFPQERQLDAELLIASPVRHSMVLGIRALGQRLAVLDGRRAMSIALDEALGAVAPEDRPKMGEIVDDAWHGIDRANPGA